MKGTGVLYLGDHVEIDAVFHGGGEGVVIELHQQGVIVQGDDTKYGPSSAMFRYDRLKRVEESER